MYGPCSKHDRTMGKTGLKRIFSESYYSIVNMEKKGNVAMLNMFSKTFEERQLKLDRAVVRAFAEKSMIFIISESFYPLKFSSHSHNSYFVSL